MPSDRMTRSGSETLFTLEDMERLIRESKNRIISRIDRIEERIASIEDSLTRNQTEQIRLDVQNDKLKDLIINQQMQIESIESRSRRNNLIFNGLSESDVHVNGMKLKNDIEKLNHLCKTINANFQDNVILSSTRLGKSNDKKNNPRPLKVVFNEFAAKNEVLYKERILRQTDSIQSAFGTLYANKDSSFLMRKEEKRLRDALKALRSTSLNPDNIYLSSGKLYNDSIEVDRIDIRNQLF